MESRSKLRETAMIILYQIDICRTQNIKYDIDDIIKGNQKIENNFVNEIVHGVIDNENEIISVANKYLIDWNIERLDKTGSCILKMALYELMKTDTPEIVVINEAIELAKKYSDDSVRKIINAVLDKYIKE